MLAHLTLVGDRTGEQEARHRRMHRLSGQRPILPAEQVELAALNMRLRDLQFPRTAASFALSRR
jgi:hypothetical protein